MDEKTASAMPGGYRWQIDDSTWIGICFRMDANIVLFTDEGICEYFYKDDGKHLSEFFEATSILDDRVIHNGGPLPDVKPSRMIRWTLGEKQSDSRGSVQQTLVSPAISVEITDIQYDGAVTRTEADEYVEIGNSGDMDANLSGWQLCSEGTKQVFTFPQGTTIAPGQFIRVYTNQVHPETGGFSFGSGRALWNNQGDVAQLIDDSGVVKSRRAYGNQA